MEGGKPLEESYYEISVQLQDTFLAVGGLSDKVSLIPRDYIYR